MSRPSSMSEAISTPEPLKHVAIIMDGNGRWAAQHHAPRLSGHQEGLKAVGEAIEGAMECGVKYLTLYAFSVENWKRPASEVLGLMELLAKTLEEQKEEFMRRNIRLTCIGRRKDLPLPIQKGIQSLEELTAKNDGLDLIMALSYSSRVELCEAVQGIAREVLQGKLTPEQIDESVIQKHLYTASFPDPDLLIRTSGEMRLSNFLLWQLSYAELYMTPTLWPDFKKDDFKKAVEEYHHRHRRYGKVN